MDQTLYHLDPSFDAEFLKKAQEQMKEMADDAYRQFSKAREKLTKRQFRAALYQAIASGDFMIHIRVQDQAQCVDYLPFRQVESLKARIKELEEEVEMLKDPPYA